MSAKVRRFAKQLLSEQGGDPLAAYKEFLVAIARNDASIREIAAIVRTQYAASDVRPYFFEHLLQADDPGERRARGAFYTPDPIAKAMLSGLMRECAERTWSFDHVRILDPACGTGVFPLALETDPRLEHAEILGYDLSPQTCEAASMLLQRAKVSCRNPLAEGEAFVEEITRNLAGPLVVIGNPPYANFGGHNRSEWLDRLLRDYAIGPRERKRNLHDDYVKFIRFAQEAIRKAGRGIICFVVNRTFLVGVTYGGMRAALSRDFSRIEILDLHGDGEADDANVFGIRRGTAIITFTAPGTRSDETIVRYSELRGSRSDKFRRLLAEDYITTERTISVGSFESWVPIKDADRKTSEAYRSWPSLTSIFSRYVSGVQTKNDRLFVGFSRLELTERIKAYLAKESSAPLFRDEACSSFGTGPWDERTIYYEPSLLGRARYDVMRQMLRPNIGLAFVRQAFGVRAYDHVLAVGGLISDRFFASRRGAPFLAPLHWHENDRTTLSNLNAQWLTEFSERIGESVLPADAFAYAYAILFAPAYRQAFDRELRVDFPRVPYPRSSEEFHRLQALGERLLKLHLAREETPIRFTNELDAIIPLRGSMIHADDELRYGASFVIRGIERETWEFHAGGFRVAERFLKQRRGRTLDQSDRMQLARIAHVAKHQPAIMNEIDAVVKDRFASLAY